MSRADAITAIVDLLGSYEPDKKNLREALEAAMAPLAHPLDVQVEALSTLSFWMEYVGNERRTASGVDKLKWQYLEGHLEGQIRALDKGITSTMHHNNMAERAYQRSGR